MSPSFHFPVWELLGVLQGLNNSSCHLMSPSSVAGTEGNTRQDRSHSIGSIKPPPFS